MFIPPTQSFFSFSSFVGSVTRFGREGNRYGPNIASSPTASASSPSAPFVRYQGWTRQFISQQFESYSSASMHTRSEVSFRRLRTRCSIPLLTSVGVVFSSVWPSTGKTITWCHVSHHHHQPMVQDGSRRDRKSFRLPSQAPLLLHSLGFDLRHSHPRIHSLVHLPTHNRHARDLQCSLPIARHGFRCHDDLFRSQSEEYVSSEDVIE